MNKTILVAEDNASVLKLLAEVLTHGGYHVIPAENGQSAIRKFRDNKIDLVITDVVMPDTDGLELIMSIRTKSPSTPIIAMSGSYSILLNKDNYLTMARGLGADRVFTKPIQISELLTTVGELLNPTAKTD